MSEKKKVSILIPCYNEEDNVIPLSEAITAQMNALPQYDYEICFIDNDSKDFTRVNIRKLCEGDSHIKAIFNVKNFGQFNSPYHGLTQMTGDCVILMCADFQDPVDMIPKFLEAWEEGYQIVCGIKTHSKENKLMYWLRSIYYKLIKKFSQVEQIEHFTGFALYDKSFIKVLKDLNDPTPFLRGIVAELGGKRKEIEYTQEKRRAGKTKNNFYSLFDAAMLSVTSYTKIGMRIAEFAGFICAFLSILAGFVYLIMKLVLWNQFIAGQAPLIIIVSFLGSVILAFLGFFGEYLSAINMRLMHRPLVIEEERINFPSENKENRA